MAQTMDAAKFEKQVKGGVKASKYGVLNSMTVDQLKAAKKAFQDRLDKNDDLSPEVREKMTAMVAEYERTERQIHKYYQRVNASPYRDAILNGKGRRYTLATLTIRNIKGLTAVNDKDMGKLDRKVLTPSNMLIAAGVASTVAGGLSIKDWFLAKLIWKFLTQNKMQAILFGAGAGLIAAGIIAKKAKKYKAARLAKQAEINKVENEISEENAKTEAVVDEEALKDPKLDLDKTVEGLLSSVETTTKMIDGKKTTLVSYPLLEQYERIAMTGQVDGRTLSPTQRLNLLKAIQKAKAKLAKLDKEIDKTNNTNAPAEEAQEEVQPKEEPKVDPAKVAEAKAKLEGLISTGNEKTVKAIENREEFKLLPKEEQDRIREAIAKRLEQIQAKRNGNPGPVQQNELGSN